MIYKFDCAQCSIGFESQWFDQKYCSKSCKLAKERIRDRSRKRIRPYRRRDYLKHVKDYIYADKLAKGCSRCSEKRPNCLQYHHLDRNTKVTEISKIKTFSSLMSELPKCVLLCANCHAAEELGDGYRNGPDLVPIKAKIRIRIRAKARGRCKPVRIEDLSLPKAVLKKRESRAGLCRCGKFYRELWQRLCNKCFMAEQNSPVFGEIIGEIDSSEKPC